MNNCIIVRDTNDGPRYWNGAECRYEQNARLCSRIEAEAALADINSIDHRQAEGWQIRELAEPLFYYNGVRDTKGAPIQRCWYSRMGAPSVSGRYCAETITMYARDYQRFSAAVRAYFTVENDTDTMTDYFDQDRVRVQPSHPLYPKVLAAYNAMEQQRAAASQRRDAKRAANRAKAD